MRITIKCFATLSDHTPPDGALDVPDAITIGGLLPLLRLGPDDIKLIFVNSKNSSMDTVLADGDQVGIFPAVGGG